MMRASTMNPMKSIGPREKSKHAVVMTALALSLFLAGCGGGSTESMLTSAKEYLAKNDNKAAIIQIKNALQKNPDSPEGRFLLGSALLKGGDPANAEAEFRKALALKHSPDQLVPELARAMLSTRQYKKLTDEFSNTQLTSPRAKAELQVILGSAYSEQGKKDLYQAAMAAALVAEPGFAPALVAQAHQMSVVKDFDGALALADEIIAKTPNSAEAWKLKGDILYFTKNQPKEALLAYRKVIEIRPELVLGQSSVMTVLLGTGDLDEAAKQLEALKKLSPNHPQTKYFQTQLAYQKRDFKTARESAQQLLRVVPDNPRAMQLAGVIEFQLNSLLQAETLLSKAVAASPELVLARRILILTYLRSGQTTKALATLNQGIAKGFVDPEINTVAGEVYLQNGDTKKAEEYFAKALKLAPTDARKRTSLALTQMVGGNVDAAFGELQDIASSDSGATADMALISAHLRRGDLDKALLAIDGLEKKQPDKPLAANLRGRTLLAKKDVAGARKSFERALTIDPQFFPAVASLAGLDLADKKPEDAKKRFEAVLAKNPKNVQALLAIAELAARNNASKDEVSALITKAIDANPTEAMPRLLLIEYYMRNKDLKQAMSVAQNALTTLPDSPEVLEALGRVQLQSGEQNQALSSFNKLTAMQPLSPKPHLLLAEAQLAAKNKDGATQNLRKALDIKPDLIEAQRGLILLYLDAKKVHRSREHRAHGANPASQRGHRLCLGR